MLTLNFDRLAEKATKRNYETLVEASIAGIPCLLGVISYHKTAPWRGSVMSCPSDLDWYGYEECEFDILDRRGYYAAWLERKVDRDTMADLERNVLEHYAAERASY